MLELLDGLQNVLPYGVGSEFLMRFSNLANAYKKSELVREFKHRLVLLELHPDRSGGTQRGTQVDDRVADRPGTRPQRSFHRSQMHDSVPAVCCRQKPTCAASAGAYLVSQDGRTGSGRCDRVASCRGCGTGSFRHRGAGSTGCNARSDPAAELTDDIQAGQQEFLRIVSSADGIQCGSNQRRCNRHLSNTVFNVMRGGIPVDNFQVDTREFGQHVAGFNRPTYDQHRVVSREPAPCSERHGIAPPDRGCSTIPTSPAWGWSTCRWRSAAAMAIRLGHGIIFPLISGPMTAP